MEKNDDLIREKMAQRAEDGQLPCAVAFDIAGHFGVGPEIIGSFADKMGLRLVKCQLGLFGYEPEKKIVKARPEVSDELRQAVLQNLENKKLPCRNAFKIAKQFNLCKMDVSGACETLDIKIKPCQLGAF
jgi:hypothetical protein